MQQMELNELLDKFPNGEDDLERTMRLCNGLGEFLNECAKLIFNNYSIIINVNMLPDEDILELTNWWKKRNKSQKYTIQIAPGPVSCLNVHWKPIDICISDQESTGYWQAVFNRQEIEELKQRNDIAIDWDKAIIKPVEDE